MVEGTNGQALAVVLVMVAVMAVGTVAIYTGCTVGGLGKDQTISSSKIGGPSWNVGCSESDNGAVAEEKGFTGVGNDIAEDHCYMDSNFPVTSEDKEYAKTYKSKDAVHEYFCSVYGVRGETVIPCDRGYTCKEGVCVRP